MMWVLLIPFAVLALGGVLVWVWLRKEGEK
jgi:hypothetical protein